MNQQQAFAIAIEEVLVIAMLAAMFAPGARFGFVVGTVGKATVVGVFALLSTVWFVYAQRYGGAADD